MATIDTTLKNLPQAVDNFIELFAVEFFEEVVRKTPVRSGYLQSRWQKRVETGTINISNDAGYASYVEFGTEKMAPVGMLRTTLENSQQIADRIARKVSK